MGVFVAVDVGVAVSEVPGVEGVAVPEAVCDGVFVALTEEVCVGELVAVTEEVCDGVSVALPGVVAGVVAGLVAGVVAGVVAGILVGVEVAGVFGVSVNKPIPSDTPANAPPAAINKIKTTIPLFLTTILLDQS